MKPTKLQSIAFCIFLCLFFLVWSLRATVFFFVDQSITDKTGLAVYSQTLKFVLWVIPVFVYIKIVDKSDVVSCLKLTSVKKQEYLSVFIWLLAYTLIALTATSVKMDMLPHGLTLTGWIVLLLKNIISPLSEEILFRGFVLSKFLRLTTFWKANIITTLLFTLVHVPNWFWTRGPTRSVFVDLASVAIFSLFLGYLYKKYDSLLPNTLAHMINNMMPNFF